MATHAANTALGFSVEHSNGRETCKKPVKALGRCCRQKIAAQNHPALQALPNQINHCAPVPAILDQGTEGACTGFALAAAVNYLLAQRKLKKRVSPRMLYELARRYDEWPGEDYAGSSARGAQYADQACADEAIQVPGGAYYRVDFRQVRHVHAALHEIGIVYVTMMVHAGWAEPGSATVTLQFTDRDLQF